MPKIPELPQANELKPNDLFIVHLDEQDATNSITFEKIADLFVSISGDTMTGTLEMPSGIATYLEADEGLFNDSLECMGSGFFGKDLTCAGSGLFNNIKANEAKLNDLIAIDILCSGNIEAYGGVTASGGFLCPSGASSLFDLQVENTFSVGTGLFNHVDTSSGIAGRWSMGSFEAVGGQVYDLIRFGDLGQTSTPTGLVFSGSGIEVASSGIGMYGPYAITGESAALDVDSIKTQALTIGAASIQSYISGVVIDALPTNIDAYLSLNLKPLVSGILVEYGLI